MIRITIFLISIVILYSLFVNDPIGPIVSLVPDLCG